MTATPARTWRAPSLRWLITVIAGALLTFSYAPFGHEYLVIPLFALVIWLAWDSTPRQGWKLGYGFGLGWFTAGLSWIYVSIDQFGGLPLPATLIVLAILYLYLSLFPALAFYLWRRLAVYHPSAILVLPLAWLISESLRGWLFTGFPWLGLGYTQVTGWFAPWAPLVGERGLAVILVSIAAMLVWAWLARQAWLLLLPVVFTAAPLVLDQFDPIERTGETTDVLLVQGNIEQSLKWDAEQQWPTVLKYLDLSRPDYGNHDLVIWPESAITVLEPFASDILSNLDASTRNNNVALITGIIDYQRRQDIFYNSLVVVGQQADDSEIPEYSYGGANRYRKHQLLPIGEFVPFAEVLRPIAPLFNLPMSSFSRGDYIQPNLEANGLQLLAAICYEIAFPDQVRANLTEETDFLLTVSNDTWFGDSHGPWQHMQIAQMRALELGRPLLRATNNGVSAVVNEYGERQATAKQFESNKLSARVAQVRGETLYRQYGVLFAWLIAGGIALAYLVIPIKRLTRRSQMSQ